MTTQSPPAGRTARDPLRIGARLDRLPIVEMHRRVTLVVGLGLLFDAFENFLSGTIGTVLKTDFAMSGTTLSLVLSSAFIGQFLGALLLGRVADRVGRRTAYLLNLGLYSLFSLLGAFAPDATWLIVTRFVAGIGVGGELALADSYLSDLLPPARRGRFISWAYTVSFLGVPLVGFLALLLAPRRPFAIDGWRWLFVIGSLGAGVVWVLRRSLPESPRWLAVRGRHDEADRIVSVMEEQARGAGAVLSEPVEAAGGTTEPVRLTDLFSGRYARRTVMLWVLSGLEVFGYYGFGTLAPLALVAKGYDIVHSLGFTAITYLGYPIGSLLSVPLIERGERKVIVIAGAGAMAVMGTVFGFANSTVLIVGAGFLYTVVSNVFSNAYHVYLPEQYPTEIRASAAGAAYSLSKLVTASLPFILLPVLNHQGSTAVFGIVAAAMVICMLDVALLGPRTTGRPIDAV